jgi:hypothetical protein
MNPPRYTLGSVTGYTDDGRHPATIWYIHDRLHCYRIIREFYGAYAHTLAKRWLNILNEPGTEHVCTVCGTTFPRVLLADGARPFWAKRCDPCRTRKTQRPAAPRPPKTI